MEYSRDMSRALPGCWTTQRMDEEAFDMTESLLQTAWTLERQGLQDAGEVSEVGYNTKIHTGPDPSPGYWPEKPRRARELGKDRGTDRGTAGSHQVTAGKMDKKRIVFWSKVARQNHPKTEASQKQDS